MNKSRPLAPKGGNDDVYTPPELAKFIIHHFNPSGSILEPCRGTGSFWNNFPPHPENDWAEIKDGRDFLSFSEEKKFDWTISNPPWSLIRPFLRKSMKLSDNIVFLCLINAFFMRARLRDIKEAGFYIHEILALPTPPKPWPATGFQLGAIYVKRGVQKDIRFSFADESRLT
jgi:hypothetical protein